MDIQKHNEPEPLSYRWNAGNFPAFMKFHKTSKPFLVNKGDKMIESR